MLTLNYMVNDILLGLRDHLSDDDSIDPREIAFHIKNQRALWLRNQFNKGETIDDEVIQSLGAVELEPIDMVNDYVNINLPVNKRILRTKQLIPGTIERHRKPTITYVGPLTPTSKKFKLIDMLEAPYVGNGKFNRNDIFAFLMNDRMYLIGDYTDTFWKGIRWINIRGVFEDPELVGAFKHQNGEPCFTWDSKYPLKHWMYTYLKGIIIQNILGVTRLTDNINNSNNDLENVGAQNVKGLSIPKEEQQ